MKLRLKELRQENDYTQREIAEILRCSISTYSKYERGEHRPTVKVLVKLADFYKVSFDYIIGRKEEKEIK